MAHISEYQKEKVLTVQEGLDKIKSNNAMSFIWMVVENSLGIRFELGGRNYAFKSEGVEIKSYIPEFDSEGKAQKYKFNDFANHTYSIDFNEANKTSQVDYPTDFASTNKFKTLKSFVDFIDKRDWVNNAIFIERKPAIVHNYSAVVTGI